MYKRLSAPLAVQWEVTPACNHLCLHCYNYWRKGERLPTVPPDFEHLYTAVVDEILAKKVFMVIVTGGEPLLVLDKMAPYIRRLTENGVAVSMNTNLTLLTDKKARLLKEIGVYAFLTSMPSGIAETCDRITNVKGSLKRIVRGITIAQKYGFQMFVNMVVSRINFGQIEQTAELVKSLGVKNFAATRASNPVSGSWFANQVLGLDEFRQMVVRLVDVGNRLGLHIDSLEANPPCAFGPDTTYDIHRFCGAGRNTCTVGHDGRIRPCNRLPIGYGHIYDGLEKAWLAMDDCRSGEQIPDGCQSCKLKLRCGGGCKADALVERGDLKQPDPLCDLSFQPVLRKHTVVPATADVFAVNPRLRLRDEEFGAIAYVSVTNWVAVDGRIVQMLRAEGQPTIEDFVRALSTSEDSARKTVGLLVEKKILMPSTGQK